MSDLIGGKGSERAIVQREEFNAVFLKLLERTLKGKGEARPSFKQPKSEAGKGCAEDCWGEVVRPLMVGGEGPTEEAIPVPTVDRPHSSKNSRIPLQ